MRLLVRLKIWRQYFMNVRDLVYVAIGYTQSLAILIRDRPDVVFSKGGYPALPVCLAAATLRIRFITHDSDSIPGLSHKVVSRFAHKRLFGVPLPEGHPDNWLYVGVPLSKSYTTKNKPALKDEFTILATGGGLGSKELNNSVVGVAMRLKENGRAMRFTLITGDKHEESVRDRVISEGLDKYIDVIGFTGKMHELLSASHVVISRAGATILAELAALGKPSILIPNPLLPGSHQVHNANIYKDRGAAILVSDAGNEIDREGLYDAICKTHDDTEARLKLGKNMRDLAMVDSTGEVAKVLKECINE